MRAFSFISILLTLTLLTGCNTFERRAQKKADVFAALSPEAKVRLENKVINVGDSPDMVYIALGTPDEKRVTTSATGETVTWLYNRYWQEYRGEAYGGFVRRTVRDPQTGATSFYLEPVSRPIYAEREEPIMRVLFVDGKVTVVEQVSS